MKNSTSLRICAGLLILLFAYTATSKLLDMDSFRMQMNMQVLPVAIKPALIGLLPASELLIAGTLCFRASRYAGFWLSFLLMLLFTGYVGMILTHSFSRIPCSCGGVFRVMGWRLHLWFNLFFLLLSIVGIYLQRKEVAIRQR